MPAETQEYLESADVETYYPQKPIDSLPKQTEFMFTKMLDILIQPNAKYTKMYSLMNVSCEIFSEDKNSQQLRVALPKKVKSISVIPFDENRICIKEKIPVPVALDANSLGGACQLEGNKIINMTSKCYQAVLKNDEGNGLWTTKVTKASHNPRLYAVPGLANRMDAACKKDAQMIKVDFEGELAMTCYDSYGLTKMSEFVMKLEDIFKIKVKTPLPENLKDVKLREKESTDSNISI